MPYGELCRRSEVAVKSDRIAQGGQALLQDGHDRSCAAPVQHGEATAGWLRALRGQPRHQRLGLGQVGASLLDPIIATVHAVRH